MTQMIREGGPDTMQAIQRTTLVSLFGVLAVSTHAVAANIEVEAVDISGPAMVVGTPTNQVVSVFVRNVEPGLAGETAVEVRFPFPLQHWDIDARPLMVAGELSWDGWDGTSLFLADFGPVDFLDDMDLTAVGLPGSEEICGIYGLDMHPDTGQYWVIVGSWDPLIDPECERANALSVHARYLGSLDPFSGEVAVVGQTTAWTRNLAFLPDGTLLTQGGWDDSAYGGRLYSVDLASGALTLWHTPSTVVSGSEPGGALTWNPTDNRLWFFDQGRCVMIGIDPATKSEVLQDTDYCGGIDTGMRWFRDGEFFFQEEDSLYRQSYDTGGAVWANSYMGRFSDNMRDWVFGGNWHNEVDCVAAGAVLTCTVPDVVPWGGWIFEVDAVFTPDAAGSAIFRADTSRLGDPEDTARLSETRTVLAPADLDVAVAPRGERYFPGDALLYTVDIANQGDIGTADVTLVLTFPDNVTPVSLGAAGGFGCGALQPDRTVTCNRAGLAGGAATTLTYNVTAGAEGVATLTAVVSTSTDEPNLGNNAATSRLVFGPAVDLQLSLTAVDAAIAQGAETTITVTVVNNGPDVANGVVLTVPVSEGLTLDGATCTVADAVLSCDLGGLAVDASVDIELGVTAGDLGGYFVVAPVAEAGSPPELTPGDNAGRTQVGVMGPSLTVAAGPASPTGGAIDLGNAAGLQLSLTHGGGSQDLIVRALTVESTATVGGLAANVSLRVVHDLNGNGTVDADEPTLTTGAAVVAGTSTQISLGGLIVPADATMHVLLIPTSVRKAAAPTDAGSVEEAAALLLPFVAAGFLALRRRRTLWVLAAALMVSAPGCGAVDDLLALLPSGTIQLRVTAAEASIPGTPAPDTVIEGLPIEGPALTFTRP